MTRLLRRILLTLGRSVWLRRRVPRLPFMRRAVRRFMPGESIEDALRAAAELQATGVAAVYTRLGESIVDERDAQAVADHYVELLRRSTAAGIDGEISVKPTQLGLEIDADVCLAHVRTLARAAEEHGAYLWLDMEDGSYTDRTLGLYERLRASHARTGVCLQAYLRRTAADVERLLPLSPAIRLVKGAYDEPESAAYRTRREVDASFAALAVTLLREARTRGPLMRVALGTHDVPLIEQIARHAAAADVDKQQIEVHMLYGIRAAEQRRLANAGYAARTLIAYGDAWYPWYMRRLAERPANVLFALRQLLP